MNTNVDPDLIAPLEAFLAFYGGKRSLRDIPATRAMSAKLNAAMKALVPRIDSVATQERRIAGPAGAPDLMVRIYQPAVRPAVLPALVWIHGGGYVIGSVDGDDVKVKQLVEAVGCVAVSVEYRLAPEHPFPAPLEDCYAALMWLAAHAGDHGVDVERIAIGGASAGGGLAAGLALLARDRGEVPVAFQLLVYPMLDDRNVVQAGEGVTDSLLWTREDNMIGWRSYLGARRADAEVSPYAAPFRATDLAKLPPAYIPLGELDLFLDEDLAYARRLIAAGVPTEVHVYPGAYHGFESFAPASAVARRFIADRDAALKRALRV